MASSFGEYFQQACTDESVMTPYIRNHHDTSGYCSVKLYNSMKNTNVISRIRNAFVEAINKEKLLPKAVIVVLDDDLLKVANHMGSGLSKLIVPWLSWLASELHRIAVAYKEKLPAQARKLRYPQFLWILAVFHDSSETRNEYRKSYNVMLESVLQKYKDMQSLPLLMWDKNNKSNYIGINLSSKGKERYWMAVNDAFQSWDKQQMCIAHGKGHNTSYHRKTKTFVPKYKKNFNRFHWNALNQKSRLPRPPPLPYD